MLLLLCITCIVILAITGVLICLPAINNTIISNISEFAFKYHCKECGKEIVRKQIYSSSLTTDRLDEDRIV